MIEISEEKAKNEQLPDEEINEAATEATADATADAAEPETAATEENAEADEASAAGEESKKEKKIFGKKEKKPTKEEYDILNDKYLRVCAEYDNFRKRSQKEKDNLYGDVRSNVITAFLPVYDNLVRALQAPTEDENYRKGVEMIMNQFNQTLEKLGVTAIPDLGEKFNPELHNAVMHVDDESKGENEIVEVFQKGFKLGDKIIRFSMVKVAN